MATEGLIQFKLVSFCTYNPIDWLEAEESQVRISRYSNFSTLTTIHCMLSGYRPKACSGSPLLSACYSQFLRLSWDSKEGSSTFQLFKIWKTDFQCNRCKIASCAVPRITM